MLDLVKKEQEEDYDNNRRSRLALIVSNETNTLSVLTRYLKAKGFQVYGFTNPLKAFEHFKKRPMDYCIVISDTRLCKMNGFVFARKIRQVSKDVLIILTSVVEIDISEFIKVLPSIEIDGIIPKPVSMKSGEEHENNKGYWSHKLRSFRSESSRKNMLNHMEWLQTLADSIKQGYYQDYKTRDMSTRAIEEVHVGDMSGCFSTLLGQDPLH
jgi:response regulator RpfG family c-di-GMP phosphodiesterase